MGIQYSAFAAMFPGLHLKVQSGEGIPELTGAIASEVLEPASWLEGGELLITTGMLLTPATTHTYVQNVRQAGVSVLILIVGPQSPHTHVPQQLQEACAQVGVTLASVSEAVAPSTIVRTLYEAIAQEQRHALEFSVDLLTELSRAVGQGLGPSGVLAVWEKRTGTPVVVLNRAGRLIAGDAGQIPVEDEMLQEYVLESGSTPRHLVRDDQLLAITPLGAARPRGYLVAATCPEAAPVATAALVSLLGLELERLWLADEPERLRRAESVEAVLAAGNEAVARSRLRAAGLTDRLFHVVVIDPAHDDAHALMADLAIAVRGGLVRRRGPYVELIAGQDDSALGMLEKLAPSHAIGIGAPLTPGHLAESRTQALAAVHASNNTGRPVMFKQGIIFDWLIDTGDPVKAKAFSDAILAPLENADEDKILLTTVKAWMEENCSLQATCDRLGIHRHTLRSRLRRIELLIHQPLDTQQTRTELWLALNFRPASDWARTRTGN